MSVASGDRARELRAHAEDRGALGAAAQLVGLADRMLAWTGGNNGMIDLNGFQQKFQTELNLLRDKVAQEHGDGDEWLSKIPSSGGGVRGIADALRRVAQRIP